MHAGPEDGRADSVAGGAASVTEPRGTTTPESSAAEPAGWLLLIEPERPGGESEAKPARAPGTLETLVHADLLRALRNTGLPVRISVLSHRGPAADLSPAWSPESGTAPTLLVFTRELDSIERLEQLCTRARQLAGLQIGVLACLFPEQPPLPALLLQAADRLRRAGADDVLLGIPAAVELLDRAQAVRRVREQQRSGEKAQLQLRALTQGLQLLCPELAGSDRPGSSAWGPREENAPEPVGAETSVDPSESARAFQRFTEHIRNAIGLSLIHI